MGAGKATGGDQRLVTREQNRLWCRINWNSSNSLEHRQGDRAFPVLQHRWDAFRAVIQIRDDTLLRDLHLPGGLIYMPPYLRMMDHAMGRPWNFTPIP